MSKYLTLDEFAEREGVSKSLVKKWIKAGRIKANKIDKKYFIYADETKPAPLRIEQVSRTTKPGTDPHRGLTPDKYKSKFGTPRFQAFVRTVEAQGPTHPYWNWIQQGRKNGYKLPEEVTHEKEEMHHGESR